MSKPDVMILHPLRPCAMARLGQGFTLHRWDEAADRDGFLEKHGPQCRALVSNGHAPVTAPMLDHLPRLELVACSSAGFDTFDIGAIAGRGIALSNSSPALCDDVADTAILLTLAARRSLIAADAYVRSGAWARDGMFPLQRSVKGARVGVVGMGNIGQAIARRCEALGMQVSYWNRREKPVGWAFEADLVALARHCDTLIAIVAGGEGTRGLISAEVIDALGPEGLLVNVARGSVVDEPALIAALSAGRLGHAALDVFANEPDPDPRLTALANTTLLPHHASGTVETRDAMANLVVDNIEALFAGRPLPSRVDLAGYVAA